MILREQQQEEIATIRPRTIEVKLSDADVKRISEKAGEHGLTVAELLQNFIGDLVDGTYSNGSDERMYAEQWLERCWFGSFPDETFLRFLIIEGALESVIKALDDIETSECEIRRGEEALKTGTLKSRSGDHNYSWKDLENGDGTPGYTSKEEWECEMHECIKNEHEYISDRKATINNYWTDYAGQKTLTETPPDYKEQMQMVLNYWKRYENFLGEDPED